MGRQRIRASQALLICVVCSAAFWIIKVGLLRDETISPERRGIPRGAASLNGTVSGAHARSLQAAVVTLKGGGGEARAITGRAGDFAFPALPAGSYTVIASKVGYVTLNYGQRFAFEPATVIRLLDGEKRDKVDFVLPLAGSLSGRVTNETGKAVSALVVARPSFAGDPPTAGPLLPESIAPDFDVRPRNTDVNGNFNINGLPPGAYFVSALPIADGETSPHRKRYLRHFYPGSPDWRKATRVKVAAGQATDATIRLQQHQTARIVGSVQDSRGRPVAQAPVKYGRTEPDGSIDYVFNGGLVSTGAEGTFVLDGLLPGEYVVTAASGRPWVKPGQQRAIEMAHGRVSALDTNKGEARALFRTKPGSAVEGQVITEDAIQFPGVANLRVTAIPVNETQRQTAATNSAPVGPDGRFRLLNVFGEFRVTSDVDRETGWYVKGMIGADTLRLESLDGSAGGTLRGIALVLSAKTAKLHGTVFKASQVAARCLVIVFSDSESDWKDRQRKFVIVTRTDWAGAYSVSALIPGAYRIVPLESFGEIGPLTVARLKAFRESAALVNLAPGETATHNLTVR